MFATLNQVLQENKARQIFQKKQTKGRVGSEGKKFSFFKKNLA